MKAARVLAQRSQTSGVLTQFWRWEAKNVDRGSNNSFEVNECLVGAGRFERPTPCAQGSCVRSKRYMDFRVFLTFTTTWGICSSLDSQPKWL